MNISHARGFMNQPYKNQRPTECSSPTCRQNDLIDKVKNQNLWRFYFINSQGNVVLETSLCAVCSTEEFGKASQNLHERIKELEEKVEGLLQSR